MTNSCHAAPAMWLRHTATLHIWPQAARTARGEERSAWLALTTQHQLPGLVRRLGAGLGAEAAGGNGAVEELRASLDSPAHTELTRWLLTEAAVHAGAPWAPLAASNNAAAAAALAAAAGHLAGSWRRDAASIELLVPTCFLPAPAWVEMVVKIVHSTGSWRGETARCPYLHNKEEAAVGHLAGALTHPLLAPTLALTSACAGVRSTEGC